MAAFKAAFFILKCQHFKVFVLDSSGYICRIRIFVYERNSFIHTYSFL